MPDMQRESVTFEVEWMQDKRLTWPARILLAKITRLTDNGQKEFRSNNCNAYFMGMMGFTLNEVKNSWVRLIDAGYIHKHTNKIANNETIITLNKEVAQFKLPIDENNLPRSSKEATGCMNLSYVVAQFKPSSNHSNNHSNTLVEHIDTAEQKTCTDDSDALGQNGSLDNDEMTQTTLPNCQDRDCQNGNVEVAKMAISSSDRNKGRNIYSAQHTKPIHEMGIPSPQKEDSLSSKEGDPIPKKGSHLTKVNISNTLVEHIERASEENTPTASAEEVITENEQKLQKSVTEPKKSKKSEEIKYPTTVEEVEELFREHIEKWSEEKPEFKNISIKYESEKFLKEWTSRKWKRKSGPVKSVKGTVATWIENASTRSCYRNPKPQMNTFDDYRRYGEDMAKSIDNQIQQNHTSQQVPRIANHEQQPKQSQDNVIDAYDLFAQENLLDVKEN